MLDLNTTYTEKFVASGELSAYAEAHAHVLARCQAREESYAD